MDGDLSAESINAFMAEILDPAASLGPPLQTLAAPAPAPPAPTALADTTPAAPSLPMSGLGSASASASASQTAKPLPVAGELQFTPLPALHTPRIPILGQSVTEMEWASTGASAPAGAATLTKAEHSRAVLRHLSAQALASTSFPKADSQVLESVTDLYASFIQEIGSLARRLTEHTGRTDGNANDVRAALSQFASNARLGYHHLLPDWETEQGSSIISRLDRTLDFSAGELARYYLSINQEKVAQEKALVNSHIVLSQFRTDLEWELDPHCWFQNANANPFDDPESRSVPDYIPSFVPRFPANHTYLRTLIYPKRLTEWHKVKPILRHQQRDLEISLSNFFAMTSLFEAEPVSTDKSVKLAKVKPEAVIVEPDRLSYLLPITCARGPKTLVQANERMNAREVQVAARNCPFLQPPQLVSSLDEARATAKSQTLSL